MTSLIDIVESHKRKLEDFYKSLKRLNDIIMLEKISIIPLKVKYVFEKYPIEVHDNTFEYDLPIFYEGEMEDYLRIYMIGAIYDKDPKKQLINNVLEKLFGEHYKKLKTMSDYIYSWFLPEAYGDVEEELTFLFRVSARKLLGVPDFEVEEIETLSVEYDRFKGEVNEKITGDIEQRFSHSRDVYIEMKSYVELKDNIMIANVYSDISFGIHLDYIGFKLIVEFHNNNVKNIKIEDAKSRTEINLHLKEDVSKYEELVEISLYQFLVTNSMLQDLLEVYDIIKSSGVDINKIKDTFVLLLVYP